ncbi:MAG: Na/Pi symporter [Firmicutes bacterium]|nr:Na/Pi symporter [Bacillota bacterium]
MALLFLALGLVLFLGGLRLMSAGMEGMSGTAFADAIHRYTKTRTSAFFCGLLFTALTQSSSLATVIVVGVVDAGLMSLAPAIAVIIGANVGTTFTGQLLSFHLYDYALPLAAVGIILAIFGKRRIRQGGRALTGVSVLLVGLKTMGTSLEPFISTPWFNQLLNTTSTHPVLGVAVGAFSTAVVQSSSAVVGMVLALAKEGALTLAAGAAVVVGADVGTCITSLLAGLGAGVAARRAAVAHLLFNIFSVLLILPLFSHFINVAASSATTLPRQLANAHTLYNLSGAILLLLFLTPFQIMVEKLVRSDYTKRRRISNVFSEVIRKWF